jgi:hypothetical protein
MIERQRAAGATRPASRGRMRLRAAVTVVAAACALAGAATTASAQSGDPAGATTIGGLIDELFKPAIPFNPANDPLVSPAEYAQRAINSREGIAIGVGNALASFPLGASSAGFTYSTNKTTGESELRSVSFGPVFVERALTNGKGVLNLGVAYQASAYDTLQGLDLSEDGFVTQSQRGTFLSDGSDVGDTWKAALDIDSQAFLFSGSFGLTDNLDLGWVVPVVSLSAQGRFLRDYNGGLDYDRNANFLDANGNRVFIRDLYPNKTGVQTLIDHTIDATGVGDIVLRTKYGFGVGNGQRVMVLGDLRLPTGDEENLLGTGEASFRAVVGGSARLGESAALNGNVGYTVGGLTDEFNFSAGTEVAVLPSKQLTLTFDFIGQNLRDTVTTIDTLVSFDQVLSNIPDGFGPRRVQTTYDFWERGSTTLLRAAVGAKLALGGNWLLTGSALFRLNDNGYQAKVVPFIGIEHTWATR